MCSLKWRLVVGVCLLALGRSGPAVAAGAPIPVVVSAQAQPAERVAAEELAGYLGRLYPEERFAVAAQVPETGRAILLGSVAGEPRLKSLLPALPTAAESFVVGTAREGQLGVIAGADARGVLYGVYGLLEKLGCGFYLSYETLAPARRGPFTLEGWQLSNRPMVKERVMLNWHNFLSGCSVYNLEDWNAWTRQSQRMGYNGIMLHCYGNNPMISYTFNGKTKPVGYLSTTVKGRDWSTMHVNDVRKMWGGEVFPAAVFGADAGQVPDAERVGAVQKLMGQAFAYAAQRAMGIYLAMDMDTPFANPQDLILTLPPSARFAAHDGHSYGISAPVPRDLWLANPDTPEGYQFYRAQIEAIMKVYPQITTLIAWFRPDPTAWINLKREQMPAEWQAQYRAEIAKTPEAEKLPYSVSMFAISKVVQAYQRALRELGHGQIEVAAGSWRFNYARAANRFMPPGVRLFALNFEIYNGKQSDEVVANAARLPAVGAQRPIIPIFWAHHDDGAYIGRGYPPTEKLYSRLTETKSSGFGINHWISRPLDLFLAAQMKQVWQNSLDQPLRVTCGEFAERAFGAAAQKPMTEYLEQWATGAPAFGRDTSERFQTEPLRNVAKKIAGCEQRIKKLESVDRTAMTPEQRDRWSYYRGLEEFIIAFHRDHEAFQKAEALYKEGRIAAAREMLAPCHPEQIIEQFARFSSLGGITRGEQGLVVSMNTRWLSHYVRLRQALAVAPIRYRFGPTSRDSLAQGEGPYTFYFDDQRQLWQTLGAAEIGATPFTREAGADDCCRSGIETDKPWRFTLEPILGKGSWFPVPLKLLPGRYTLRLWLLDPTSTAVGQRVFDVAVHTTVAGRPQASTPDRVDIFQQAGGANRVLVRTYPITVPPGGTKVELSLTPVTGKALLCAVELTPAEPPTGK